MEWPRVTSMILELGPGDQELPPPPRDVRLVLSLLRSGFPRSKVRSSLDAH